MKQDERTTVVGGLLALSSQPARLERFTVPVDCDAGSVASWLRYDGHEVVGVTARTVVVRAVSREAAREAVSYAVSGARAQGQMARFTDPETGFAMNDPAVEYECDLRMLEEKVNDTEAAL